MTETGESFRDIQERLHESFPELGDREVERLAASSRLSVLAKGEWVCMEGDGSAVTFWLVSGHVELLKGSASGKNTVLHVVRAGHFLDLYGVFGSGAAFLSARALTPCVVLAMDNKVLRALLGENIGLAQRVMQALAMRQRMFINKIAGSQGKMSVRRRVAGWLLHKARVERSPVLDDVMTREVLAGLLGLSRESLSRQLSRFVQEGLIRLERRTIILVDEEALRRCLLED